MDVSAEIRSRAQAIKLLIADVDGVLTNGELLFIKGEEYKAFNSRDGLGIALLLQAGIEFAIISGNQSGAVEARFKKFGLTHIYQGQEDKRKTYEHIKASLNITNRQVAYIGDDLIDLPIMKRVALPAAVADANDFVKTRALWISKYNGGAGAVRELIDIILHAQGLLDDIQNNYWQL